MSHERDELIYKRSPQSKEEYEKFNAKLAEICGRAPNGEGWLTAGWGMDVTRLYQGIELPLVYDPDGKFWGAPFNVITVWVPPDVYDRTEWASMRYEGGIDVLGPFPEKGVRDLFKMCYRVDGENIDYMPLGEEMLDIARRWKAANEGQDAKKRAIDNYKSFNEARAARRNQAWEKQREQLREDIRRELDKPIQSAYSFAENIREAGVNDVPAGFTRTATGIIAPQSAVAQEN